MNRKLVSICLGLGVASALGGGLAFVLTGCELDWGGNAEMTFVTVDADICTTNTDCNGGYCNLAIATCIITNPCSADAACTWEQTCDVARGVCVERPLCTGDADCATGTYCEPFPGAGTDGACVPGTPVACATIADETTCLANAACTATYTGSDCTAADGTACDVAAAGCTCASFAFAACQAK